MKGGDKEEEKLCVEIKVERDPNFGTINFQRFCRCNVVIWLDTNIYVFLMSQPMPHSSHIGVERPDAVQSGVNHDLQKWAQHSTN